MNQNFEDILDKCLADPNALAKYPELAGKLEPLLEAAQAVRDVEHPETDIPFKQSRLHHRLEACVEDPHPLVLTPAV